jgi:hypothetical protein
MSAIAQAPLPFIAALTILGLALLGIIAKAVFAPTDDPARRLYAILSVVRRHGTPRWPSQAPDTGRLPIAADGDGGRQPEATTIASTIQASQNPPESSDSVILVPLQERADDTGESMPATNHLPKLPGAAAESGLDS